MMSIPTHARSATLPAAPREPATLPAAPREPASLPAAPREPTPLKLSWNECHELVELLAQSLHGTSIDTVVGISRSGLIPAVMLSHALSVRDFAVLDIARTRSDAHHSDKHPPVLRDVMNARLLGARHVLLVDDIVGAGDTLRAARAVLASLGAQTTAAALVFNRENAHCDALPELDYYGCRVESWVEFPWECKDFERKAVEHA